MSAVPPGKAVLSVQNIVKSYGGQPILENVSLTVHEGDRIGLIGRNGSGKSTLMRIIAGLDLPDDGLVTRGNGLRVALLEQQDDLDHGKSVEETLRSAAKDVLALMDEYHAAMERLAATRGDCWEHRELQEQCDRLHHTLDIAGAWTLDHDIKRISVALDLPAPDRVVETLSGGEIRRLDLAVKLIQRPDVLLLDEPTNHIDHRSVEWIESFLEQYPGSCILVTHDRYFLDRVVNRIVEIEFQKVLSFPGNYERFLLLKSTVQETEARTEINRLALIRRELAWLQRGAKARTTKQKARINRATAIIEQGPPQRHREFEFEIPEPEPLSKTILEARHLFHGYGERTLFRDFSFIMQRQMRVGIIGPNGSGKTTLLRVLMGREEARKGRLIIGDTTAFLYVDQAHEEIEPEKTILQFVSDGARSIEINRRRIYVPAYLEKFLFDKDAVEMPIGNLSGGERNRLYLVKKLLQGGNFLVLDEPTNDLDLYTLRILEETIENFDGCALIVSHDRYFLNRVCTHMLIFERDGAVVQIAGNYDDYLLYKERQEAAAAANRPAPVKTAPVRSAEDRKRRLTWKEKNELDHIEEIILDAESEVARIETAIHEPGFYEQEHTKVTGTLEAFEAAKKRVDDLYARWEELNQLKENG